MKIKILSHNCTGPNPQCKRDARNGRLVHMIADIDCGSLVMPTYHFASEEEGREALTRADETAPTVTTDAELYEMREQGIPHKLPAGWVDPSRRS